MDDLDVLTDSVVAAAMARTRSARSVLVTRAAAQITNMGLAGLTATAAPIVSPKAMVAAVARKAPTKPATRRSLTRSDLNADDAHRMELCFHEAGHAVGGVLLGGGVASAEVFPEPREDLAGWTTFSYLPGGTDPAVAFAGPWAQARWNGSDDVWSVLHRHRRGCDLDLIGQYGDAVSTVALEAAPVLARAWPAVVTVARDLFQHGEIQHKHVLAALGVAYDQKAAFGLANVRAGLRPVPDPRRARR